MGSDSPKADALREMRERQHAERERVRHAARRTVKGLDATRAELDKAVCAVAAKPRRHK
jgi:hypothetical protein